MMLQGGDFSDAAEDTAREGLGCAEDMEGDPTDKM